MKLRTNIKIAAMLALLITFVCAAAVCAMILTLSLNTESADKATAREPLGALQTVLMYGGNPNFSDGSTDSVIPVTDGGTLTSESGFSAKTAIVTGSNSDTDGGVWKKGVSTLVWVSVAIAAVTLISAVVFTCVMIGLKNKKEDKKDK